MLKEAIIVGSTRPGRKAEARPGGRSLVPLLDRVIQRPPKAQLHLDPQPRHPVPKRKGVDSTGEFRRKVLKQGVPITGGARVVAHQ
jgi:hypothetical protein